MNFDRLFSIFSYAAVFCGFVALWISGVFGFAATTVFTAVFIGAAFLERTRWQIPERPGTALIVFSLPFYFVAWQFRLFQTSATVTALPSFLAFLIVSITAVKLLQRKSHRDWVFLYLMAFFEVLLAAGLSISSLYVIVFGLFVFTIVCSVVMLEMLRTSRRIRAEKLVPARFESNQQMPIAGIPTAAAVLITLTAIAAIPMFFLLPRVGGAGFGNGTAGVATYSGFSDVVRLGEIGRIQESDEVVMRARIETPNVEQSSVRWRGVALDTFDNLSWKKSLNGREPKAKGDKELIQVGFATGRDNLAIQTIYLEPLDSAVIFGITRPVGVQGNFPFVFRDAFGSLTVAKPFERISYRVFSDVSEPSVERLRSDNKRYSPDDENYLQLPLELDTRVAQLSAEITRNAANRYDAARAIEAYLQNEFGYTLERKAAGNQPLADFLFNVREGHCEYFSTAMAVMLRTQGIATRIVNGFQAGEYNETADVFVIRQKNAHSWVEVYFPGENAWVTFDPTPFVGRGSGTAAGYANSFNQYAQALEMFWIQYFVAFDNQEQRTLFTSIRKGAAEFTESGAAGVARLQQSLGSWWIQMRGDAGLAASLWSIGSALAYIGIAAVIVLFGWLTLRRAAAVGLWSRLAIRMRRRTARPELVDFYHRMQTALAKQGHTRKPAQTPLEFAETTAFPEAVSITRIYNDVRFGKRRLSTGELASIENLISIIEAAPADHSR